AAQVRLATVPRDADLPAARAPSRACFLRVDAHRVEDEVSQEGSEEPGVELGRPGAPLLIPEHEAVRVEANHPPLRAHQAYPVSHRDREAASIAGLSHPSSMPQLDRVIPWEPTRLNPLTYEMPDGLCWHQTAQLHTGESYRRGSCPETAP